MDKKLIATILGILGVESLELTDGRVSLKEDDVEKLQAHHQEKFNAELVLEGISYDEDGYASFLETEILTIEAALAKDAPTPQTPAGETETEELNAEALASENETLKKDKKALEAKIKKLETAKTKAEDTIIKLAQKPEEDVTATQFDKPAVSIVHSKTHLMASGKSYDAFENRPWNKAVAGQISMAEYTGIDISQINQDLGEYYRQDINMMLSFLRAKPRLPKFWPTISNVTDELVHSQVISGEVTQARKKKWLPKGNFEFQPVIGKVYPIQIDVEILGSDLQALERSWMNQFNKEGSQAYKMSFVAFLAAEILKKASEEDEIGLIKGVYHPTKDDSEVAGMAKYKMNGLRKLIISAIIGKTLIPSKIGLPTTVNIMDYVRNLVLSIPEYWRDMPNMKFYMSSSWKLAYLERREALKGLMPTYDKSLYVDNFENIEIIELPYLDGSNRMFITTEDNIAILENIQREKHLLRIEQSKRDVAVFGDYKLGIHVFAFGKQWKDGETPTKDYQMFFCNDVPDLIDTYIPIDANDTTPSVKSGIGVLETRHLSLQTGVNTEATAITDFEDVNVGEYLYVKGNTGAYQSTMANAGKFDLSAAITLTENTLIKLYKRGTDDFVEIQRWDLSVTPYVILDADATTADALEGTHFITQANSDATAITDVENAVDGETYRFEGGSDTNASTIAASGKFSRISEAITLEDGNWIDVMYVAADDKLVELGRYVAA